MNYLNFFSYSPTQICGLYIKVLEGKKEHWEYSLGFGIDGISLAVSSKRGNLFLLLEFPSGSINIWLGYCPLYYWVANIGCNFKWHEIRWNIVSHFSSFKNPNLPLDSVDQHVWFYDNTMHYLLWSSVVVLKFMDEYWTL